MKIAIRTDASVEIGTGHVMRCLTLAHALRDNGVSVVFICREHSGNLISFLENNAKFPVIKLPAPAIDFDVKGYGRWIGNSWEQDAQETNEAIGRLGSVDWLVVDHYGLDIEWERAVRQKVRRLFVIDDLPERQHECDIFLNQNFGALSCPGARLSLIGPKYAILRKEFLQAREKRERRSESTGRVLVFFGGSDPTGEIAKLLDAFPDRWKRLHFNIILGLNHPEMERLKKKVFPSVSIQFFDSVSNMGEMMAESDLFVGAGGTTTWERLCVGLPSITIAVAENQEPSSVDLAREGYHLYLGRSGEVSGQDIVRSIDTVVSNPCLREFLSKAGKRLVDGRGADRILGRLGLGKLEMRHAGPDDKDSLLTWRNAPENRAFSFNTAEITAEDHSAWFAKVMNDPNRILLIAEAEDAPVGVLRYDIQGQEALVSIYLVPGNHGKGFGSQLLSEGTVWLERNRPEVKIIRAEVDGRNAASRKAFLSAGYAEANLVFKKEVKA